MLKTKRKFEIFYKGALKHGNLEKAYTLKRIFEETFGDSIISPYKYLRK